MSSGIPFRIDGSEMHHEPFFKNFTSISKYTQPLGTMLHAHHFF